MENNIISKIKSWLDAMTKHCINFFVSKSFFADKKRVFYEVVSAKKKLPPDMEGNYIVCYTPEGYWGKVTQEIRVEKGKKIAWLARPQNCYEVYWMELKSAKNVC